MLSSIEPDMSRTRTISRGFWEPLTALSEEVEERAESPTRKSEPSVLLMVTLSPMSPESVKLSVDTDLSVQMRPILAVLSLACPSHVVRVLPSAVALPLAAPYPANAKVGARLCVKATAAKQAISLERPPPLSHFYRPT